MKGLTCWNQARGEWLSSVTVICDYGLWSKNRKQLLLVKYGRKRSQAPSSSYYLNSSWLEQAVRPKGWKGVICRNSLLFHAFHFSKQEAHGTYKEFEKMLNFWNLICFFDISGSNTMTTIRIIFSPTFPKIIHRF